MRKNSSGKNSAWAYNLATYVELPIIMALDDNLSLMRAELDLSPFLAALMIGGPDGTPAFPPLPSVQGNTLTMSGTLDVPQAITHGFFCSKDGARILYESYSSCDTETPSVKRALRMTPRVMTTQ